MIVSLGSCADKLPALHIVNRFCGLQSFLGASVQCKASRQQPAARRSHRVVAEAATQTLQRTKVPAELEKGDLPMNTFNNKKPFKATVKSVERIVGPKATGEDMPHCDRDQGRDPILGGPVIWCHPSGTLLSSTSKYA